MSAMPSPLPAAETRPAPPPRESDPDSVGRYLLSFEWPMQNKAVFESLVKNGMPLWLGILSMVPQPRERGRLLELGSPPFNITLLVQKFRNYELTLTAATADGRPRFEQRIRSAAYGEEHCFECHCFDIERTTFPFPDDTFDVVMWCEVIEHLTQNPIFTLREIHRVLKPGGAVVISTPNVARVENLLRLWLGSNVFDPYHLGAPLQGSRHSREYTLADLTDMLTGCGFRIDVAEGRDLNESRAIRIARLIERIVGFFWRFGANVHADHLFVRAVKGGPFRWAFPECLFDPGHLLWYLDVRDREVVMGQNEIPHTTLGWGPLEVGVQGKSQRRAGPIGDAYVVAHTPFQRVVLEIAAVDAPAPVKVEVWQGAGDALHQLALRETQAAADHWSRLEIPVGSDVQIGKPVQLRILAPSGVYVHRIALES